MNQPTNFDLELLDRYLSGEASREERARAELWLSKGADRQALVNVLSSVAVAGQVRELEYDMAGDWAKLKAQLHTSSAPPRSVGHSDHFRRSTWSRYISLGVAATFIFVAAPKLFTYWSEREKSGREMFMPPREYATARGQRVNLELVDGTKATLGPESRLKVTGNGRTVELKGEALFEVAQSARIPFTVVSAGVNTTVLGTTFAIRAYDSNVRVAVKKGKVAAGSAVLSSGDVLFVRGEKESIVRGQNVSAYFDWADGRLVFSNTPVPTVVEELSRWYDVNIQLGSPELASSHFTASFKNEPLEFVLNSLNVTLGARYERTGNRVTLLKSSLR